MSAIDRLLNNYARQVRLPWSASMSGKQRVWFAVYPPAEERRVRAKQPQFEATTLEAQHGWLNVDLTDLLPKWIAAHEYREGKSHLFQQVSPYAHLISGGKATVARMFVNNQTCPR